LPGRFGRHFPAAWELVEEHSLSGLVEPGSRSETSRWVAAWPASDLLPPSHPRSGLSHASTFSTPRGSHPIQVVAAHVGAAARVAVVAGGGQWVLAVGQEVAEVAELVDSVQHSVDELPAGAPVASDAISSAGKCVVAAGADPLVSNDLGRQASVIEPVERYSSA